MHCVTPMHVRCKRQFCCLCFLPCQQVVKASLSSPDTSSELLLWALTMATQLQTQTASPVLQSRATECMMTTCCEGQGEMLAAHKTAFHGLCRLTKNENAVKASHVTTQGNFQPSNNAQFVCPITGQELNGRFRFSVLRTTGDVISERAIKQVRLRLSMQC